MNSSEAVAKLEEIRRLSEKVGREHSAADAAVTTLKSEFGLKLDGLKRFGINSPSEIQPLLDKYETEMNQLMEDIDKGVPQEFR